MEDDNYDLLTASGDRMTVLGTSYNTWRRREPTPDQSWGSSPTTSETRKSSYAIQTCGTGGSYVKISLGCLKQQRRFKKYPNLERTSDYL